MGDGPQWIRESGGMLQVLCIGAYGDFSDPNDDTPGGIWLIDPATNSVVDSLVLAAGIHRRIWRFQHPERLFFQRQRYGIQSGNHASCKCQFDQRIFLSRERQSGKRADCLCWTPKILFRPAN
ncbi:MAG: hypothetical protein R3C26_07265 [Calditrichia bacterium]